MFSRRRASGCLLLLSLQGIRLQPYARESGRAHALEVVPVSPDGEQVGQPFTCEREGIERGKHGQWLATAI